MNLLTPAKLYAPGQVGHRAHQVVQLAGGLFQSDGRLPACGGQNNSPCSRPAVSLKVPFRMVGSASRSRLLPSRVSDEAGSCRLIRINGNTLLRDDGARIRAVHAVQGHAGFSFAIHQHPVQRRAATVGGQQ